VQFCYLLYIKALTRGVVVLFTLVVLNDTEEVQWCIAKNGGGYTQTGVAKGLKVPCLFMIAEVSIRCQKTPEVGIRRIPAYPPQYTTEEVCFKTFVCKYT